MPARGSIYGYSAEYGKNFHYGQDYQGARGRDVRSIAAGTVVAARTGYDGGRGENVEIAHASGISSRYYHFSPGSTKVSVGEAVQAGKHLGDVGETGFTTAVHLHLEVVQGSSTVDPWNFLLNAPLALATPVQPAQEEDQMKAFFVKKQNDNVVWLVQGSIFRRRMMNDRDWTDTAFLLEIPKSYREVQALDSCGLDVATFV